MVLDRIAAWFGQFKAIDGILLGRAVAAYLSSPFCATDMMRWCSMGRRLRRGDGKSPGHVTISHRCRRFYRRETCASSRFNFDMICVVYLGMPGTSLQWAGIVRVESISRGLSFF